jgi:GNAT superfamily N-acetyltransferase
VLQDPSHGFYVVADAGREIAGALLITYEWSDWRNGRFWWIQSVYVPSDYRRRGVYRALEAYVKAEAEAQGDVCGFRLYVEKNNHVAQQVYANLGMVQSDYDLLEIDFVLGS